MLQCSLCGRFMGRLRDYMGPKSTAYPPDRPDTASSVPYGPFTCMNHGGWGHVEFHPSPITAAQARAQALASMSEAEFFEQIRELAKLQGWYLFHVHDSRHTEMGWPDVVLLRQKGGQTRMVVMELKRERSKVTLPQQEALDMLAGVSGIEVLGVVRPSDWDRILEVLE